MKKILIAFFLILCMLVTLVSCVDPEENSDGTPYGSQPSNSSTGTLSPGGTGSGPQLGGDDPDGGQFGTIIPAN